MAYTLPDALSAVDDLDLPTREQLRANGEGATDTSLEVTFSSPWEGELTRIAGALA